MASGEKSSQKSAIGNTNSASLIALAAEIAKHEQSFQRVKGSSGSLSGIRAPKSKPTVWQRQNTGLSKRAMKDDIGGSGGYNDSEAEATRKAAMERKAKVYEMLERGEDVPDQLREELLVEFEHRDRRRDYSDSDISSDDTRERSGRRRSRSRGRERGREGEFRGRRRASWGRGGRSRSRSSDWDRDESAALARDPKEFMADPWVEHVDEFGRTRLMRQSEVPKPELRKEDMENPGIHNPANPFPVFRNQDAVDKQEWIRDATGELKRSNNNYNMPGVGGGGYSLANTVRHYSSAAERRAHGVGFYQFSQDEEERAKQMQELRNIRSETETKRALHRPLREKRRGEIEARKKIIQQKRLKSLASTITAA
ncbi:hypothetical protein BX616_001444 [Lobosporangium transversale]|uniref:CCDC174 alpha/beta GRSR domain-containing protein n=1 Tax=Lobosporangium transversale TaxID=64571 RepID=A0A1Y2GQR6_9FUNG|nr:hypothetical protein BCR41DRAFT_395367 [Lobosporangium transversale]KAF9903989.1 hypothetical protein BX616_001444 [Lobosporangium transversale]ORZ19235.1 hypothetical protein BCR41DRAFT_395367 [Lobosporangium transversale]|eukprot:XP_021882403.1 hypothetical protein BCR41DRAFT_395367 [Lobosporangium transversale]